MVDTIKFSQMTDGGDIDNNKKTPGLSGGANVLFNNPWTFLPPGTTAQRPTPSAEVNYRLRFNTEDQLYEYYDAVLGAWTQLQESMFTNGPFIIYEADPSIPDGQNLGALANGILKQSITLGVATLDIAVQGTDYYGPGDSVTFSDITMTGNIDMGGFRATNAADPIASQDYATKFYVDQNSRVGTQVYVATAGSLGTVTQSGSGIGATLTNAGVQALLSVDGVNPPVGSNILVKDAAMGMTAANEGIYTVTDAGSAITNWVITRSIDYDTPDQINSTGLILVINGSTLSGTTWYNTTDIVTVDFTAFSYQEYGNNFLSNTLSSGKIFRGDGSNMAVASTASFADTYGASELLYSNGANNVAGLATAANGVLATDGSGIPSITSTLPSAVLGNIPKTTIQIFSSGSDTYTTPANCTHICSELWGAGGGGGGAANTAASGAASGTGGDGGGYCKKIIASPAASYSYSVGAAGTGASAGNNGGANGGDTTFGTLTASGGGGGGGGAAIATLDQLAATPAFAPGTGTNGDINITGSYALYSQVMFGGGPQATNNQGGNGANGGSGGHQRDSQGTGFSGNTPGGGGGGGASINAGGAAAGGDGGAGLIVVEEYYNG